MSTERSAAVRAVVAYGWSHRACTAEGRVFKPKPKPSILRQEPKLVHLRMVVDQQDLAKQLGRRPVQHPDGVAEQRRERLVVEDDDDRDLWHLRRGRVDPGLARVVPVVRPIMGERDVVAEVKVEAVPMKHRVVTRKRRLAQNLPRQLQLQRHRLRVRPPRRRDLGTAPRRRRRRRRRRR